MELCVVMLNALLEIFIIFTLNKSLNIELEEKKQFLFGFLNQWQDIHNIFNELCISFKKRSDL